MAERATEIVQKLRTELTSEQVFEAFEALDALPASEVKAALVPITGPAPDPEALDESVRVVHGFPLAPVALHCTVRLLPVRAEHLALVGREQIVKAGKQWDGVALDAAGRMSDPIFADGLETRSFADAKGRGVFDVVLHGGDTGTIFAAGTSNVVGAIAYGSIELRDRARRLGLEKALAESASMTPAPLAVVPNETPSSAAPTLRWLPESEEWAAPPDDAQTVVIPGKYDTNTRVLASQADTQVMPVIAPAPARAPKKIAAVKKAPQLELELEVEETPAPKAKKAAVSKKKTAAVEEAPAKKTAAKKATTKKAAADEPVKKKASAVAKKTATAKKTAAKKTAAKKTATAKKPAAKKTTTAKKTATAKKPAAAKKTTTAKKTATAKKPAAKKTAAKKTAKKPAAKKR